MVILQNPPYDAAVTFEVEKAGTGAALTLVQDPDAELCLVSIGWESPKLVEWLSNSLEKASQAYFGKSACCTN